ncbi:hypothetical protein [Micromonospora zhanjiangensis]|uniref:Uncharacterized protein n=1 Tax=Micromonospora zhanjiangensis TaxID=1522057 RepID=A0ABV8KQU8_9ACTN
MKKNDNQSVRPGGLVHAVRRLADHHAQGPALIVRTPDGSYLVSADGSGEGPRNRYVISRSQLGSLMRENDLRREHLADPHTAGKVAALVAGFRPPGAREG